MAFFGFGRKQQIKKPLTEPLGIGEIAELPPLDTSLPEDRGLPQTRSLNPSDETAEGSERVQKFSMPEFSQENEQRPSSFQRASYQQPQQTLAKDIELISSKLDYLKAALDNLNQRLANLERIAQGEQDKYRW